jgi:hypothetical protein
MYQIRIWSNYIFTAAEYANLPLIQPYLFLGNQQYVNGINFASGGAGALVESRNQLRTGLF